MTMETDILYPPKEMETYPPEYRGARPIEQQIESLAQALGLRSREALIYVNKGLPDFSTFVPENALPWVEWFAVPSEKGLASLSLAEIYNDAQVHCGATNLVLDQIGKKRRFYNYHRRSMMPNHFRVCKQTSEAIAQLSEHQPGDIHIIACQLGMRFVGLPVTDSRQAFARNEFGLASYQVGAIAFIHPERLVRWRELGMLCVGDEFNVSDSTWDHVPILHSHDEMVKFNAVPNSTPYTCYGAVTAFLPPE